MRGTRRAVESAGNERGRAGNETCEWVRVYLFVYIRVNNIRLCVFLKQDEDGQGHRKRGDHTGETIMKKK